MLTWRGLKLVYVGGVHRLYRRFGALKPEPAHVPPSPRGALGEAPQAPGAEALMQLRRF